MFQAGFDDRHKLFLLATTVMIAASGCAGSGNSSSGTPLPGASEPGQAIVLEQQTSTVLTTPDSDSDQTGWDLLWQSQTLSGAQAQSPLLASAERFLDHGHSEIAASVLQLVQQHALNHSQVFDLDLLQSRVALQSGHPHTALAVLDRHKDQTMKPAQQAEGLFFETVAYLQLEEIARALEPARQLETLVIRHDLDSVYPMFLHHLKSMPTAELGYLVGDTTTPTMAGWGRIFGSAIFRDGTWWTIRATHRSPRTARGWEHGRTAWIACRVTCFAARTATRMDGLWGAFASTAIMAR